MRTTLLCALLLGSAAVGDLRAEPITYIFTGTGSGTLGATVFTDAEFTITVSADTEVGGSIGGALVIFDTPVIAATVTLDGFSPAVVSPSGLKVFCNQTSSVVGLNRFVGGDLVTLVDPAFSNFDLDTPLGPIFTPESGVEGQFQNLLTDVGGLTMNSMADLSFEAILGMVGGGGTEFVRGDVNGDGVIDIADPIANLSALFGNGASAVLCLDAADANDDGTRDIADAIFQLQSLFAGSAPELPPPGPDCGSDPTGSDPLDCEESPCGA